MPYNVPQTTTNPIPTIAPFNQAMYGQTSPQTYYQPPVQPIRPMTMPVRYVDIVMVDNEQAARNYDIARGTTQALMDREENHFFLKTVHANGEVEFISYDKRPKIEPEPAPKYVTADDLDKKLNEFLEAITASASKEAAK